MLDTRYTTERGKCKVGDKYSSCKKVEEYLKPLLRRYEVGAPAGWGLSASQTTHTYIMRHRMGVELNPPASGELPNRPLHHTAQRSLILTGRSDHFRQNTALWKYTGPVFARNYRQFTFLYQCWSVRLSLQQWCPFFPFSVHDQAASTRGGKKLSYSQFLVFRLIKQFILIKMYMPLSLLLPYNIS